MLTKSPRQLSLSQLSLVVAAAIGIAMVCTVATMTIAQKPTASSSSTQQPSPQETTMQLGNFSVSLAVKHIKASKAFYEKLDFQEVGGNLSQNWLIMQNGTTTIGLFQGMFEKNMMTFNPGWNHKKETPAEFDDVRDLQRRFKQRGLKLEPEADESSDGPANFALMDPDGNPILFDQHVPKPK